MGDLDGWAVTIGTAACRYLLSNNHDAVFGALCSEGASAAGWYLVILALLSAAAALMLFRLFRPR